MSALWGGGGGGVGKVVEGVMHRWKNLEKGGSHKDPCAEQANLDLLHAQLLP